MGGPFQIIFGSTIPENIKEDELTLCIKLNLLKSFWHGINLFWLRISRPLLYQKTDRGLRTREWWRVDLHA